ncbi:MAG: hypothetical protein AAGK78_11990, partial [Planctomycetota bacterium]
MRPPMRADTQHAHPAADMQSAAQGPGASCNDKAADAQPVLQDMPGSLDIAGALADWDHDADRVAVRIIRGDDHLPKMQMRLDLGLLQMETAGRPDGLRPHHFVSLLAYHMDRLEEHILQSGTPREFVLSPRDCRQLRDEARMFSQRMLGWFVLGEWDLAEADVQLVQQSMDFVRERATEPRDRGLLLGWKPYVTMMHARCRAAILVGDD